MGGAGTGRVGGGWSGWSGVWWWEGLANSDIFLERKWPEPDWLEPKFLERERENEKDEKGNERTRERLR